MRLDDDGEYVDDDTEYKEDDESILILLEDDDDKLTDNKERDQVGRIKKIIRQKDIFKPGEHENNGLL